MGDGFNRKWGQGLFTIKKSRGKDFSAGQKNTRIPRTSLRGRYTFSLRKILDDNDKNDNNDIYPP